MSDEVLYSTELWGPGRARLAPSPSPRGRDHLPPVRPLYMIRRAMAQRPPWQRGDESGVPGPLASALGDLTCIPPRGATCLSGLDLVSVLGSGCIATLVLSLVLRRPLAYYLPGATIRPTWSNDW